MALCFRRIPLAYGLTLELGQEVDSDSDQCGNSRNKNK